MQINILPFTPICVKVDSNYQLTCDREKRTIRPTQRFEYVDPIGYALTITKEIGNLELKSSKMLLKAKKFSSDRFP